MCGHRASPTRCSQSCCCSCSKTFAGRRDAFSSCSPCWRCGRISTARWCWEPPSCRFTAFERLALLLLIGLAFAAQRNIAWLALGLVPLLAPALDEVLPRPSRPMRAQANVLFALAAGAFACFALLGSAVRPESWYLE